MQNDKKMNLYNRIKENRGRLNITQAILAEEVGISRVTMGKIERGGHSPDLITALKIADAFEISIHDLFFLETK